MPGETSLEAAKEETSIGRARYAEVRETSPPAGSPTGTASSSAASTCFSYDLRCEPWKIRRATLIGLRANRILAQRWVTRQRCDGCSRVPKLFGLTSKNDLPHIEWLRITLEFTPVVDAH
jgi:hypothetical protein